MDKEVVETNIQSDIFYYKRKAQNQYLEHLFGRATSKVYWILDNLDLIIIFIQKDDIMSIIFDQNEAKQAQSQANIPGLSVKITLQNLLLDHKMRSILKNHPQYAQMESYINEYEKVLDMRAKTEIQSIYLKQTFENLDILKKNDPNALIPERKSQQQ